MLNPARRETERSILAKAPIPVGEPAEMMEAITRTADNWVRMIESLDDLACALKDVDEGRF